MSKMILHICRYYIWQMTPVFVPQHDDTGFLSTITTTRHYSVIQVSSLCPPLTTVMTSDTFFAPLSVFKERGTLQSTRHP